MSEPGNYEMGILWNDINVTLCEQFWIVNKHGKIYNHVRYKESLLKINLVLQSLSISG
jgi:hypothetical protein